MFKPINEWYKRLPVMPKLGVLFAIYFLLWFFVSLTGNWFTHSPYDVGKALFAGAIMGLLWLLFNHFRLVKQCWKKENTHEQRR